MNNITVIIVAGLILLSMICVVLYADIKLSKRN